MKSRAPYYTGKLAVDMINGFFDNTLCFEESESRILQLRTEEAGILKQLDAAIRGGKYTEQGVLEYATNLLAGSKQRQVSRGVQKLAVPEPQRKVQSAEETYRKEMVQRFTTWSGAAPVQTKQIEGKAAFFDGRYWYTYEARNWRRWDGEKWVILK